MLSTFLPLTAQNLEMRTAATDEGACKRLLGRRHPSFKCLMTTPNFAWGDLVSRTVDKNTFDVMRGVVCADAKRSLCQTLVADVATLLPRLVLGTRKSEPRDYYKQFEKPLVIPATYYSYPYQRGVVSLLAESVLYAAVLVITPLILIEHMVRLMLRTEANALVNHLERVVTMSVIISAPADVIVSYNQKILSAVTQSTESTFFWPSQEANLKIAVQNEWP